MLLAFLVTLSGWSDGVERSLLPWDDCRFAEEVLGDSLELGARMV